jgi:Fe-S oxidoreductase
VAVLEAAGFKVRLAQGRRCCGRPAFSQGDLDRAARLGRHNLALLNALADHTREPVPIIFLEPSCWAMFVEDYRELKLPGVKTIAARCVLFEQFVEGLLNREPEALRFAPGSRRVAIHAHCHAKALTNPEFMVSLAARLPGSQVSLLPTACCGMAGAFGALESQYALSVRVGEMLADTIRRQPADTVLVASGTSCRQQIEHLTPARPKHMAELLAEALASGPRQA